MGLLLCFVSYLVLDRLCIWCLSFNEDDNCGFKGGYFEIQIYEMDGDVVLVDMFVCFCRGKKLIICDDGKFYWYVDGVDFGG